MVLLHRHYDGECEHPTDAARADQKHQRHECPTAADTIEPVSDSQLEGLAVGLRAVPIPHYEGDGGPASVKASVFQRGELESSCNGKHYRAGCPGMRCKPCEIARHPMQPPIR